MRWKADCCWCRWLAPESLTDGLYTHASDVWMLGVLVWGECSGWLCLWQRARTDWAGFCAEVFSLGQLPWGGRSDVAVIRGLKMGDVMEAPAGCPASVYAVMKSCWVHDWQQRPSGSITEGRLRAIDPSGDADSAVAAAATVSLVGNQFYVGGATLLLQRDGDNSESRL